MKFSVLDVPQRTPEWFAARLGRVTGSRAADVFAATKSGEAAARKNYRVELALERITGVVQERQFMTQAMQDGVEREPDAIALYEAITGSVVTPAGFCFAEGLPVGYSPDGLVEGWTGLVEVKCPEQSAHLDALMSETAPAKYAAQMRHGLWITGAAWCDFVSYHPLFPESLRLVVRRFTATKDELEAHEKAVRQFLSEVDQLEAEIRRKAESA